MVLRYEDWNRETGERRGTYDLHALQLPSGNFAHKLNQADLYAELSKLKIGVVVSQSHYDLSIALARWLKAQGKLPNVVVVR